MAKAREIIESPLPMGENEAIAWQITITPWGDDPTTPVFVITDVSNGNVDVTATVATGSPTISGNVFTTPSIATLTKNRRYRMAGKFVVDGNTEEWFCFINAEE